MNSGVGLMLFRVAIGLLLASALTLAAQQPPAGVGPTSRRLRDSARPPRAWSSTSSCATRRAARSPISPRPTSRSLKTACARRSSRSSPIQPPTRPRVSTRPPRRLASERAKTGAAQRLTEGPPIIALAWDRLEPEGRAIAYKAARRLVETKAPGELVGVFFTDRTLQTIQPYTTDGGRLSAAVEQLASTATTHLKRDTMPLDNFIGSARRSPRRLAHRRPA